MTNKLKIIEVNDVNKKSKGNFWLVVIGLFLVISFVAGGVKVLDNQGLISVSSDMPEGGPSADGAPGDFEEGSQPTRDHDDEGSGFNSQSLMGIFKTGAN